MPFIDITKLVVSDHSSSLSICGSYQSPTRVIPSVFLASTCPSTSHHLPSAWLGTHWRFKTSAVSAQTWTYSAHPNQICKYLVISAPLQFFGPIMPMFCFFFAVSHKLRPHRLSRSWNLRGKRAQPCLPTPTSPYTVWIRNTQGIHTTHEYSWVVLNRI
jgi:hypothetical protein